MRFLIITCLLLAACGHDDEGFETFQACFDEHTDVESLPVEESIVVCALDHEFDGERLDFASADECEAYLGTHLAPGDATSAQLEAACADYIVQKNQ
ncbi:MAG: hypothetical protein WKG01_14780 [Kofleriaceae bacterium]